MVECRRLKNVRLIFGELIRGFESRPLRLSFKTRQDKPGSCICDGYFCDRNPWHAEGPRYRAGGLHRFPGNQVFEGHLPKNARLIFGVYAYYHETTQKYQWLRYVTVMRSMFVQ